ncbi:hypothetical protein OG943_07000 [Amycolatopsis sp. NBC_00345]|uniref:hypothetical protein n=1 Tax=Amycolatopsis sp. NBC_00345 TaxID=2975955 RepID=UPI002E25F0A9
MAPLPGRRASDAAVVVVGHSIRWIGCWFAAPGAGHFSFMNTPPPGTFLADLARATTEFAIAS